MDLRGKLDGNIAEHSHKTTDDPPNHSLEDCGRGKSVKKREREGDQDDPGSKDIDRADYGALHTLYQISDKGRRDQNRAGGDLSQGYSIKERFAVDP